MSCCFGKGPEHRGEDFARITRVSFWRCVDRRQPRVCFRFPKPNRSVPDSSRWASWKSQKRLQVSVKRVDEYCDRAVAQACAATIADVVTNR